ncbi:MAG: UDP-N-acetylglucosamine--LPS N-acetylglucosamine transferase [Candidatus Thiodiazotropha sp. (ex. Lucinisca nassula)]|nr:UDP-N-acetylglucosamine--LPS N-acetylglucosamine transferase [Candidatus Thiodiazotropha sp. (ex. Lucinisca nassula)]
MKVKKILAVASRGGHFIQLKRLDPTLSQYEITWVTTYKKNMKSKSNGDTVYVRDASMSEKTVLILTAFQLLICVLKHKPDIVISTGAAPGYFAVVWGKLFKAKTIWLDSIANTESMSLAGQKAKYWSDIWCTQWPHLKKTNGPYYIGSVL